MPPPAEAEVWEALVRWIQASMVKFCSCRLAGLPTTTPPPATPLRLKAWPTSPAPYVTVPCTVPLLPPVRSLALPLPGHQLTRPEADGVQPARLTLKEAFKLVMVP